MSALSKILPRLLGGILSVTHVIAVAEETLTSKQEGERLFSLKVKQIFSSKCFACHGEDPKKIKGEFDLTTREGLLKGGESEEPGVVPGKPAVSPIVLSIERKDEDFLMPPKENDKLEPSQVEVIKRWVELGAPWPDAKTQARYIAQDRSRERTEDGILIKTGGGLSGDWTHRRYKDEDVWAFRPLQKIDVPPGREHPIDRFIQGKLKAVGLKPAPWASALTLIRRATFDLTGLPPTPGEIDAFLVAWKKNPHQAYVNLVDRLLESPHYGERWGQHWLDVARYADTSGFSNDFERSNAWRYRDYVIRSFNEDKPYARFVLEQVAGEDLNAKDPKMIVAQGFLRMGPWEHTAMSPPVISRQNYLDDVVNNVGQAFLGTPLRCAKCHDHKFDPIPTRDYYRLYAAFATTQPAERPAGFLDAEHRAGFGISRKRVEELLAIAQKKVDALYLKREEAAKKWYADRDRSDEYKPFNVRRGTKSNDKPPRFVGLSTEEEGRVKVREQDVRIWTRRLERYEPLAQSVYYGGDLHQNSRQLRMPNPKKKSEINKSRIVPANHIYTGGAVFSHGEPVSPGVLSALAIQPPSGKKEDPFQLPKSIKGRRLPLARWIVHRDNGLAWRTIVNRIWHYHFGRGLAGNPNNLGATGKKPAHPELIDWLARRFQASGGSFKKMHKLIMMSRVYRQRSQHPEIEKLREKDPNNDLLAVFEPRRLSAEELRDSMLVVTGELNRAMGGLPVHPEINMEVALSPRMIQFSLAPAYQASPTPEERNRRSIYAYRTRGLRDPLMEVFNKPGSADSCEARDSAAVTPQVFTLMNGDAATKRSIAMALRLQEEKLLHRQVAKAFRLAFGRYPKKEETEAMQKHYHEMVKYHRGVKPERVSYPTEIRRSLVEEFSGDPFEYQESLNNYKNYVYDKTAAEVSPETRALADICLNLLNANEFIYVY